MNSWKGRIILVIVAIALLPLLVNQTTQLAVQGINGVIQGITSLFQPFSMTGDDRLSGLIKLCLYLVAGTLLLKYFLRRN